MRHIFTIDDAKSVIKYSKSSCSPGRAHPMGNRLNNIKDKILPEITSPLLALDSCLRDVPVNKDKSPLPR